MEKIELEITKKNAEQLLILSKNNGFNSIADYLTYICEQIIKPDFDVFKFDKITESEKEKIAESLKSLGYF